MSVMSMRMQMGIKIMSRSDCCFHSQEELWELFGYEMIEELNADAVYASRLKTFTDADQKTWMQLSEGGNQIKVIGAI